MFGKGADTDAIELSDIENGSGGLVVNGFGANEIITYLNAFSAAKEIDLAFVTAITAFADLQANHLSQDGAGTIRLQNVLDGNLEA